MGQSERFVVIDLVRTVGVFVVLEAHLQLSQVTNAPLWLQPLWDAIAKNGSYGVSMFFVVSGFVITVTTIKRERDLFQLSIQSFYIHRLARILPLLVVIIGIGAIAIQLPSTPSILYCFETAIANLDWGFWLSLPTLTFNFWKIWQEPPVTVGLHWDVLWSLAVELQFYLLFPLVVRKAGNRKNLVVLMLAIVALGPIWRLLAYWVKPESVLLSFTHTLGSIDLIAMGVLLALFNQGLKLSNRLSLWVFTSGIVTVPLIYFGTSIGNGIDRIFGSTLLGLGIVCFITGGLRLNVFSNPLLKTISSIGILSYGMYLLHTLVLWLGWGVFQSVGAVIAFPIFVGITTGFAYLSYCYFEEPSSIWIRRKFN